MKISRYNGRWRLDTEKGTVFCDSFLAFVCICWRRLKRELTSEDPKGA